jgi:hypothetical protein
MIKDIKLNARKKVILLNFIGTCLWINQKMKINIIKRKN